MARAGRRQAEQGALPRGACGHWERQHLGHVMEIRPDLSGSSKVGTLMGSVSGARPGAFGHSPT